MKFAYSAELSSLRFGDVPFYNNQGSSNQSLIVHFNPLQMDVILPATYHALFFDILAATFKKCAQVQKQIECETDEYPHYAPLIGVQINGNDRDYVLRVQDIGKCGDGKCTFDVSSHPDAHTVILGRPFFQRNFVQFDFERNSINIGDYRLPPLFNFFEHSPYLALVLVIFTLSYYFCLKMMESKTQKTA
jgi:hypothetical protein